MSLLPVMVIFGLSFPPVFFEILLALAVFFILRRILTPTGIYDLYCCLFYLISCIFV
jgi:hypothetical protein